MTSKKVGKIDQINEYQFKVESGSKVGKFYEVSLGEHNSCECAGFAQNGNCKHIKAVFDFVKKSKENTIDVDSETIKLAQSFLKKASNTKPFLKMCFDGFSGAGKTFTMALIAIGLWGRIKSKKPIIMQDTETGHKFLVPMFENAGIDLEVIESRSLADTKKCMEICNRGYSDIYLLDSITHVWFEFLEAFKEEKRAKGRKFANMITFADWGIIKPLWYKEFSRPYVFGQFHSLFCGRAGFTYEQQKNEDTGQKELVVTGVKMRAETETAFEPDITVFMERFEKILNVDKNERKVWRVATIQKGRDPEIDGKTFVNPTYEDFLPAIEYLLSRPEHSELKESDTSSLFPDEKMDDWQTQKEILLEEIKSLLIKKYPSRSPKDIIAKEDLIERIFSTRAWKKIVIMPVAELQAGYDSLKNIIEENDF